jgi:hypothetical protein
MHSYTLSRNRVVEESSFVSIVLKFHSLRRTIETIVVHLIEEMAVLHTAIGHLQGLTEREY